VKSSRCFNWLIRDRVYETSDKDRVRTIDMTHSESTCRDDCVIDDVA